MLRKLWSILGPLLIASCLVLLTILGSPLALRHSIKEEKSNAVAITETSFKNSLIKNQALSDPDTHFVPFLGSSEWNRMDGMHPSVLAERYNRSYRPYLMGNRGAASLSQYFGLQQITPYIRDRKAVVFISPQWFSKKGTDPGAVQNYLSNTQVIEFLLKAKPGIESQVAAERLLKLNPGVYKPNLLRKISKGKPLSHFDILSLKIQNQISRKEEGLFSFLGRSQNYEKRILPRVEGLPKKFSYSKLQRIATRRAKKETSNNPFGINNSFYNKRIAPQHDLLKNSQTTFSYVSSPEYTDFELLLSEFAKQKTQAIFIIPPVNKKWADYTGLNYDKYQEAVQKIKYQLKSQGFHHIADFSNDGGRAYFMQDTIHLGWNGWLAFDKEVKPFLENKIPESHYKIHPYFFTKEWANNKFDNKNSSFKDDN